VISVAADDGKAKRAKSIVRHARYPPSMNQSSEYAVGWGSLALLNAGLAQSKNRSGLVWFFVSLLLGPIATFILVAFCEKLRDPL